MLKCLQTCSLKRTPHRKRKLHWRKSRIPSLSGKSTTPAPEEMDEDDQVLVAKLKAKDFFAHLSKMTFVLNDLKCKCSNKDTLSVLLLYFDEDG